VGKSHTPPVIVATGVSQRSGMDANVSRADKDAEPRLSTSSVSNSMLIGWGVACIALGLGIFQLTLPHVLTGVLGWNLGYDDGVYIGAAVHFAHGSLPYRDFVFVQPPGIILLLSPLGLLSRLTGTYDAVLIARVVTVLVTALNVGLTGLVLRRFGRTAVLVGTVLLALWPTSVAVNRTVELEPYLVFFCLLALYLLFDRDIPSTSRVVLGGVAFGFAGVVKVWAIFPIIAVLICVLLARRRFWLTCAGIALGAGVPLIGFVVASPYNFYRQVIVSQLLRKPLHGVATQTLAHRALVLFGLNALRGFNAGSELAVSVLGFCVAVLLYVFVRHRRNLNLLAWVLLACAILSVVGMFQSPILFDHYAYFPYTFVALVVAFAIAMILRDVRVALWGGTQAEPPKGIIGPAIGVVVVATGLLVTSNALFIRSYLSEAWSPSAMIDSTIPSGSCAISDFPIDLLVANRYVSTSSTCPAIVDPYGEYLVGDDGYSPNPTGPYPLAFREAWLATLNHVSFVDMRIAYSDFFPWDNYTIRYFAQNYELVGSSAVSFPHSLIDNRSLSLIYENTHP